MPATPGDMTPITSNDRLDVMAERLYTDATRYWHIADANTALEFEASSFNGWPTTRMRSN